MSRICLSKKIISYFLDTVAGIKMQGARLGIIS
jgi:hypothetical protein